MPYVAQYVVNDVRRNPGVFQMGTPFMFANYVYWKMGACQNVTRVPPPEG